MQGSDISLNITISLGKKKRNREKLTKKHKIMIVGAIK